jgi:hypothetical protein
MKSAGAKENPCFSVEGDAEMAWWVQPQQLANRDGSPSSKWRMTASSDEDGGGPFGNAECFHSSAEEAEACGACDDYTAMITGFPPRKRPHPQPDPLKARLKAIEDAALPICNDDGGYPPMSVRIARLRAALAGVK